MQDYIFINYTIPFLGLIITLIAQIYVTNSYNKYKNYDTKNRLTGCEAARKILDSNGLRNIKIMEVKGNLTDHYDPRKKVVRLSQEIYHGTSIASVSVAAHECGHAIQDKEKYTFLKIRNTIVPFVNFSTKIGYLVVFIGIMFALKEIAIIGLILLLAMLLFQLITVPVEFNASKRAKQLLLDLNIITNYELDESKTMLNAAALTYVAGVFTTLLQILRLALIVARRTDD